MRCVAGCGRLVGRRKRSVGSDSGYGSLSLRVSRIEDAVAEGWGITGGWV